MSTLSTARKSMLAPGVLAAVLLGAVPMISACGAGKKAPTRLEYEVADGVQASAGNVVLRNLMLVADTGETEGGATSLSLSGVIANNTGANDRLTSVTATSAGSQVPFGAAASAGAGSSSTSSKSSAAAPRAGSTSAAESVVATGSASASASSSAAAGASAAPSGSAAPSASGAPSGSASSAPSASASSSAASSSAAPVALAAVSAPVNPGAPLVLGSDGLNLHVDLKKPVLPGDVVQLTFTFDKSGSTSVAVPVYSLASRAEGSGGGASQTPVKIPNPALPSEFNQKPYDLESAAPSS